MAVQTREVLKGYFNTGDKPTEAQFANLIESFAHIHAAPGWINTVEATAGDQTMTLDAPISPLIARALVVIEPYTIRAEVRKINSYVGNVVTFVQNLSHDHAVGVTVMPLLSESVPFTMYGAIMDGSSDDRIAVQAGLVDQWRLQGAFWLDGNNATARLSTPMLFPSGAKVRHVALGNHVGYGAYDASKVYAWMDMQGNILDCTINAATNVITTSSLGVAANHGIPGPILVGFRGPDLPAELVEGDILYARDRTATTLKVGDERLVTDGTATNGSPIITDIADTSTLDTGWSVEGDGIPAGTEILTVDSATQITLTQNATSSGVKELYMISVALDLSAGNGQIFCEINSLSRTYLHDVYFFFSVANTHNGLSMAIQQPAHWYKVRIDGFGGIGFKLGGQDGVFDNLMMIGCNRSLVLNQASFFKILNSNFEQCGTAIEHLDGASNLFDGVHIEMNAGVGHTTVNSVVISATSARNLQINSLHVSCTHDTQTIFKSLGAESTVDYCFQNWTVPGGVNAMMIDDAARGHSLRAQDNFYGFMYHWLAPLAPTSFLYRDMPGIIVAGKGGRLTGIGPTDNAEPNIRACPGTAQTGRLIDIRETWTGADSTTLFGVSRNGGILHKMPTAATVPAPTIASAGTIAPITPNTFISGTAVISTITPPEPIATRSGSIALIPTGLFTTDTAGNIALATAAVVGKTLWMTYDHTTSKWYPSYT